jgi:hypothetical protein
MISRPLPTRRHALITCALGVLTALACAGLLAAAALVPAPHVVLLFVIAVCVGCPMLAGWELPAAVSALRGFDPAVGPSGERALEELRRGLDALPEISHPLGF